ncbi:MAG TPA: GNAT family N-acetyltransferase [Bryobacteraceae bacterium]|nr:GNAT family N-acetyltransferase [Bryobacteraceae bacterium]
MPHELNALIAFDRRIFPASDRFEPEYWRQCESWWLFAGGVKVGCCAFEKRAHGRTLYIATTGILPKYQRRGFGQLMKAWQIAYAQHHRFRRLIGHSRESNSRMIALNERFGFRVIRRMRGYYAEPDETAVLMELRL